MPRLFCFGLGYSALTLADLLRDAGWELAGTCRDAEKQAALRARGVDAELFDGSAPLPNAAAHLDGAHVLISTPPDAAGDPVLAQHADDLRRLASRLPWVGYLSSTGVYGDHAGAAVDEVSPTRPSSPRTQRRLDAETAWRELADHAVPVHVFRLAGIYGPGRSALDRVRAGRAQRLDAPGRTFARIHVADIARALLASTARPRPGAVYNVCDDQQAAAADVTAYACELLGVTPPPLEPLATAAISPMLRSFYADRRVVRNDRLRDELGIELAYPTYREGLSAIWAAETGAA